MKKNYWLIGSFLFLVGFFACTGDQSNSFKDISSSVHLPQERIEKEANSIKDPASYNGLYSCHHDSSKKTNLKMGTLELVYAGDHKMAFKMDVANDACVGLVDGLAEMKTDTTAVYIERGQKAIEYCELLFTIRPQEIVVEEVNCAYYHGAHCNFSNTFQKQSIVR